MFCCFDCCFFCIKFEFNSSSFSDSSASFQLTLTSKCFSSRTIPITIALLSEFLLSLLFSISNIFLFKKNGDSLPLFFSQFFPPPFLFYLLLLSRILMALKINYLCHFSFVSNHVFSIISNSY